MSRPYLRGEERKRQIVEATLRLISRDGVKGATLNRIAAEVDLTPPALYGHYGSRRDILLDAMRAEFEMILDLHHSSTNPNALERLREISLNHTKMTEEEGFARAFVEFIAASPDEGLREAFGATQLMLVEDLADIIRDGQQQGTIREDVDAAQIAWMLACRAWTEDIASLMGIAEHWNRGRSRVMLDHILDFIAAK
ncbi:MAG: TetR/AcrR family transcriptional regulator [Actinobacteria bacterium]|nr:TetR/AcrR family transcriptional regulator [Actinomycetota bacterium]